MSSPSSRRTEFSLDVIGPSICDGFETLLTANHGGRNEQLRHTMEARLRGRTPEEAAEEGKLRVEGPRVAGTAGERTNVA